jgi:hypothetical protein
MYRVMLRIERVPEEVGPKAAIDIAESFKLRPWQESVVCLYELGGLTFISENDFDHDGLATQDELAAEFSGNVLAEWEDDGNLAVVLVEEFSPNSGSAES